MVELRQCCGLSAGTITAVRHFPFSVGRKETDWVIAEPGVWDLHFTIERSVDRHFLIVPQPPAQVCLSSAPIRGPSLLRNGDLLELGSVRLQFRVSPTQQRSLRPLEWAVWLGLAVLMVVQVSLAMTW